MNKLIKNILFFFLLLLLCSYPISMYITNHFYTYQKQNWILQKSDLKLDYAALGSSRVFNIIDIKSLDKNYEKKGINIGTSGSGYAENYIILSEFISKNKISTLLLNVDPFSFNSTNSFRQPFHEQEFLPIFNKYDTIFFEYIPKWKYYLWKTIPLTKYIEFNKQFHLKNSKQNLLDKNMGTELIETTNEDEKLIFKRNQTSINEKDKKYFLEIIKLCSKNKINVVLITTPIYSKNNEYSRSYFTKYIDSLSITLNLKHYKFENLIESTDNKLFKDNTHTNKLGSIEYSTQLGKALKESAN